ncbi:MULTISPECIES: hypothetical protein [unclassified Neochlamydia]|uniref:hypothetical protein n=1 Tax=unclassified Neochlamydia TaxID=2643326 RepID=UPI00140CABBB|nr:MULTISPECIES: hypothetical protein [unclassified Neochlamydia]
MTIYSTSTAMPLYRHPTGRLFRSHPQGGYEEQTPDGWIPVTNSHLIRSIQEDSFSISPTPPVLACRSLTIYSQPTTIPSHLFLNLLKKK